jgi:hypothetical protein
MLRARAGNLDTKNPTALPRSEGVEALQQLPVLLPRLNATGRSESRSCDEGELHTHREGPRQPRRPQLGSGC